MNAVIEVDQSNLVYVLQTLGVVNDLHRERYRGVNRSPLENLAAHLVQYHANLRGVELGHELAYARGVVLERLKRDRLVLSDDESHVGHEGRAGRQRVNYRPTVHQDEVYVVPLHSRGEKVV